MRPDEIVLASFGNVKAARLLRADGPLGNRYYNRKLNVRISQRQERLPSVCQEA